MISIAHWKIWVLDYVDLYLVRTLAMGAVGRVYDEANLDVWQAMEAIYQSGRAKAIGVSNFAVRDLVEYS